MKIQKLLVLLAALVALPAFAGNWPQWRGPTLDGISTEKNLPVRWSITENVVWKLAMPSKSGATPIIWGNRIFLNVADGNDLYLWCVDKSGGGVLWKKFISSGNYKVNKQNMSSPSPVTDGRMVYVMTGVGVLKAFDFAGHERWMRDIQKDYGKFGLNWGYASSPLLHADSLYIQVLHGMKTRDPSYLLRIHKKTGKTLWHVIRPTDALHESHDSYTTPMLWKHGGEVQLVITGGDYVTGHDLATGQELWRGGGFNPEKLKAQRIIASALVYGDIVYVPTRVKPLIAFRLGGRGDISESHKLFSFPNGPDVPTPVSDGRYFYSVGDKGILWCLDAKTGKVIWGGRRIKPATYSSSPVLADGKIYITNENGLTTIIKAGPQFEVLAENDLAGYTLSSPAVSGGRIFIRTTDFLYCIGKP